MYGNKEISFIGYCLMIMAYTILLVKTLGIIYGLIISIITILFGLIIMRYFFTKKRGKETNIEQQVPKIVQSIGDGAKVRKNLSFKNIYQNIELESKKRG